MREQIPVHRCIKYLINEACVSLAEPLLLGSTLRLNGRVTVFAPRVSPCYRTTGGIVETGSTTDSVTVDA
jgi:molybdopterin/thiamine biosynthesis adenylyltransferase